MRFAILEAKLALANIVRRFTILPSDKTKEPLEFDPHFYEVTYVKGGLHIKLEKLSKSQSYMFNNNIGEKKMNKD